MVGGDLILLLMYFGV